MAEVFYRLNADRTRVKAGLEDQFAGPNFSACWLIGGGPSLSKLPYEEIGASPIPQMCLNLSGARLLRPTFWTSYDPSVRFHRSVYLDPGVMKFVHERRATDLVPETSFKVCECPNTFFFQRDSRRGFADFLSREHGKIVDWMDSLVQAIDVLYRLGFRRIYLAGCEMRVRPSKAQRERGREFGVKYNPQGLLQDFVEGCSQSGLSIKELDALEAGPHYHFDEQKRIQAAANTDLHYFQVAQYLRLSRRSLSLAGLQLVSVTPHSRLNDYFPYRPARKVLQDIYQEIGNPQAEPVRGLYRQMRLRRNGCRGPMQDYLPPQWEKKEKKKPVAGKQNGKPRRAEGVGDLFVEEEGWERVVGEQEIV